MGYDMYLHGDLTPEEKAKAEAANEEWNAALAARDALKDQEGSWYSPEEEALPEEKKKKIGEAKLDEMKRLEDEEGIDWMVARRRVYSVQPTPEYIAAQERVEKAYDEKYDADPSYFRLNIWGMSEAREVMDKFGMLKDGGYPAWPERPTLLDDEKANEILVETIEEALYDGRDNPSEYVQTDEFKDSLAKQVEEWNNDSDYRVENNLPEIPTPTEEQIARIVAHQQVINEHLAQHDAETPGIAIHKLGSNDGWLVTPEECVGAVKMWDLHSEEDREKVAEEKPYIVKFVEWIRLAADRGGFTVH